MKEMYSRGLLRFTRNPLSYVGVFFVKRKDGTIRLILDARRTNRLFRKPPHVELLTAEGLGKIEVQLPEGVTIGSHEGQSLLDW